jgi:hypothetical protein
VNYTIKMGHQPVKKKCPPDSAFLSGAARKAGCETALQNYKPVRQALSPLQGFYT